MKKRSVMLEPICYCVPNGASSCATCRDRRKAQILESVLNDGRNSKVRDRSDMWADVLAEYHNSFFGGKDSG